MACQCIENLLVESTDRNRAQEMRFKKDQIAEY